MLELNVQWAPKKTQDLNDRPLFCTFLVSEFSAHSVFFSGSHCASTVVNLEHNRVNENFVLG